MANVSGAPIVKVGYPRVGRPMDARMLTRIGADGPLRQFLARLAYPDQVFYFDDFLGDTINLDNYAVANGGGAGVASFATAVASGGTIAGATGTANDATASLSLIGPKIFLGDQNAGVHIRLKTSAATGLNLECGFADAVPSSNASAVNDVDTPSVSAQTTDAALLSINTSQTITTFAFVTAGSTFTTTATTVASPAITAPTANTYYDVIIQLAGDNAYCWVNGLLVASHTGSKVEGGNTLAYWVYANAKNATSKTITIDYIAAWQDRAA